MHGNKYINKCVLHVWEVASSPGDNVLTAAAVQAQCQQLRDKAQQQFGAPKVNNLAAKATSGS